MNVEQRIEWLKNNEPSGYDNAKLIWEQYVVINIQSEMYSFMFNHPFYVGGIKNSDDEARHLFLDDIGVPR